MHAVCVQVDDLPGGPDFQILLRFPLHADLKNDTNQRLEKFGFPETDRALVCASEETVGAFLLLHEITHHRLKHTPNQDFCTKEVEADKWAAHAMKLSKAR